MTFTPLNRPAKTRERLLQRNRVQMVFQDPVTSMNPRFTAAQVVEEPLMIMGVGARLRREPLARSSTRSVYRQTGWNVCHGIQRRSASKARLARALVVRPRLLVLDEALTGLDLSAQAQIANLLLDLQAAHKLTYLLISHDLPLVARLADTIAVMSVGRIVETGPAFEIMASPKHAETLRLLAWARAAQSNLATLRERPRELSRSPLFRSLLLLAGVSVLCFLFTEMAPGSFFDEMRENPQISPDTIARLRAQ